MKILLALDESPCDEAVIHAVMRQFPPAGHELRIVHAADWEAHLPIPYQFAMGPESASHVLAARDDLVRGAETYLAGVGGRLRAAGYAVTTHVSPEESPRDAILRAADEWPADLILVGSHGRTGLDRLLTGSVSSGVTRRARCDVEVVHLTPARAS